MVKLRQAIVVEGRYDVNTLRQLVDAPIFETRGFGIMNDRERLALLRAAARRRGLIILTDSDGAGRSLQASPAEKRRASIWRGCCWKGRTSCCSTSRRTISI